MVTKKGLTYSSIFWIERLPEHTMPKDMLKKVVAARKQQMSKSTKYNEIYIKRWECEHPRTGHTLWLIQSVLNKDNWAFIQREGVETITKLVAIQKLFFEASKKHWKT